MNILDHSYRRKNNMIFLNLSRLMSDQNNIHNVMIKQYIQKVYFKNPDNTRLIICDDGCNAILQLENIFNIYILKVLYRDVNYSVTTQKIIDEIPFYISDICKLYKLNDMKIKFYIYTTEKLNCNMSQTNCEKDIFENKLDPKMNEYFFHLEFDSNYNFKIIDNVETIKPVETIKSIETIKPVEIIKPFGVFQQMEPFNIFKQPIIPFNSFLESKPEINTIYQTRMNEARQYLKTITIKPNSIIFFDIDLTLLDEQCHGIQPVIEFFNYIKFIGIKPVIVTARRHFENNIKRTLTELKNNHINGYYGIFFRNLDFLDFTKYKLEARKVFHDKGFNILMSVGDSIWDIGEYGGKGILLQ